jgi:hypothetical protein
MVRTHAQRERQNHRNRDGRYNTLNPCDGCGKSSGAEYFSHPLTDTVDQHGENWADTALVLCPKCSTATQDMSLVSEFRAYAEKKRKARA